MHSKEYCLALGDFSNTGICMRNSLHIQHVNTDRLYVYQVKCLGSVSCFLTPGQQGCGGGIADSMSFIPNQVSGTERRRGQLGGDEILPEVSFFHAGAGGCRALCACQWSHAASEMPPPPIPAPHPRCPPEEAGKQSCMCVSLLEPRRCGSEGHAQAIVGQSEESLHFSFSFSTLCQPQHMHANDFLISLTRNKSHTSNRDFQPGCTQQHFENKTK